MPPGEPLLGAHTVNRQLERLPAVGRPPKLVVDQTERPVAEQIDPIGFSAQRDAPLAVVCRNRKRTFELVLEEPLDDWNGTLGLHAKHGLAEAGGRRRSEKAGSFERRFGARQRLSGT